MACPRGVTGLFGWSLILIAALVLLVPSASAQNCVDIFSSTSGTLNGFENIVALDITVEETTPSGTELYRLSWTDDCVDPPIITDDIFNTYFTVNDTEDCTWVVSVNTELTGVPDYPTPQDQIITQVAFTDFSNITFECLVTLTHRIKDENTQKPNPGAADYVLDIFENMNTGYTIAEFNTSVHDTDGTQPNNQFSVIMDPDCPLQSTLLTYTSGMNARPVEYMLMQKVDFEVASIIPCTATFEDKGTPPLTTTTTITINVKDVNDEPPVFNYSYYYSEVSSVLSPGEPLDIFPNVITAYDGDTGINAPVTFALENANPDVNGLEYFQIKANTGEVTLAKDLDNDFLLNERVLFIVQAHEDTGEKAQAVLEVRLPWVNLVCGGFHFEQALYSAEILHLNTGEVMKVVAVTNSTEDLTYSLSGQGSQHFTIVGNRVGTISVNEADPPPVDTYEIEALAVITNTPSEQATTRVVIHVLPQSFDEVAIQTSIIRSSVSEGEGEQELGTITLSDSANIVCVKGAEPSNLKDLFTVEKESDRVWKLKKAGALDYEQTKEVTLALQAYTGGGAPTDCTAFNEDIPAELSKSESLAIITVTNTDDEAPVFSSGDLVAAYPTNEGLKRVVGPVVSVHAEDKDTEKLTYSLGGENANQFTVDEETGDVYGVEGLSCDGECAFSVTASDGAKQDQVNVKVLPLNTDQVFTFMMTNTALSEVDGKLNELSNAAGSQIWKLYVSATESTTRRGRTRYRRDTAMTLNVHVYSIKDGALMSRDELNSALTAGSSDLQADTFNDAGVFEVEEVDTTGLTVAVAVLGSLLGVVLIAGVAFFVYKKKKGKAATRPVQPSTPINTLGQAYSNPSFGENDQVNLGSGSVGHKSNGSLNGYPSGSLNGYTSAEVHRHADQDSPPLHRSPLAQPSDHIPLRTQPQGGLMRTNPSPPEYYGSSSPAPPPSFSSSTSPTYPIYAEIKKPKDSKKKIMDDIDDEDERRSTKFASVKGSPPPRRSNKEDDYDDDESGDVAYPGGKHVGFGEPAEDEKKSVAFKVKVETKEIEAENMGPAQKKAEAAKLMEANRKKLEEEGDDEEDEDDEENMKL